jgi:putative endopeptidase
MHASFSARARSTVVCLSLILALQPTFAQSSYKQTKPLDPANFDTTVLPCQDFYRFANGGWLDANPVPPQYSNWGSFNELNERNNDILHEILEETAARKNALRGSAAQLVGDFYASGMDSARIEADGVTPLKDELARIARVKTLAELQTALVHLHRTSGSPIFAFGSQPDFKNSEMMIASIDQSGLTMPDREYYVNDDDLYKRTREECMKYMVKLFALLGDAQSVAEANAATVMSIETRLAKASMARVDLRSPEKVYHKMTVAELKKIAPALNWERYFEGMGVGNLRELNVSQPEFIKEVNAMLNEIGIEEWKTYLRWQLIDGAAPYLSQQFVDAHFQFHGTVLNGQRELQPRWKRVLRTIDRLIGDALGQMYTERAFKPEAKARALAMVKNLQAAFRERLQSLEWMGDRTRQKALEKLDAFQLKIGYPDKWKRYDGLAIHRGSYILNVLRAGEYEMKRQLAKVDKPVDRTEWFMTPSTVNAYYNPTMNEIVFPAGILQPPFFDPKADDAVNYGGMGAVIGHEITHGFDDEGRKFDAKGNLTDWWTKEDNERFEQLAAIVEEQFSGYVAIDTLRVNGKLTLGENIADLGGLSIAYHALSKTLEGKPQEKIDGLTPQQRFFLAWAQMWRRNYTDANLKQRLVVDPHAPSKFRTNGPVSNMPAFFEAFGCTSSDPMVRPANKQVRIW